jgi:FkbM family methyltransferase
MESLAKKARIKHIARKLLLTVQSELPFVARAKERVYFYTRRSLGIPHETDFRILALLSSYQSSSRACYVDVGANKGQSIESILLFHPSAQIVSFEPNPGLANELAVRYRHRQNVQIVAQGLADAAGQFTLFVPSYGRLSCYDLASLDRYSAANWINEERIFGFDPRRLSTVQVQCQVSTLDSHNLSPVFMKIDVQGYEYYVLKGAIETLRRCEPILLIEDYRGDSRTVQLAQELGYEEYCFDGRSLTKGANRGDNSLLLTPATIRQLQIR